VDAKNFQFLNFHCGNIYSCERNYIRALWFTVSHVTWLTILEEFILWPNLILYFLSFNTQLLNKSYQKYIIKNVRYFYHTHNCVWTCRISPLMF
jgi:hypothetical protein